MKKIYVVVHVDADQGVEASFPDYARDFPAVLAYHFTKAEEHDRAAGYRLAAGFNLQTLAAHEEARGCRPLSRDPELARDALAPLRDHCLARLAARVDGTVENGERAPGREHPRRQERPARGSVLAVQRGPAWPRTHTGVITRVQPRRRGHHACSKHHSEPDGGRGLDPSHVRGGDRPEGPAR